MEDLAVTTRPGSDLGRHICSGRVYPIIRSRERIAASTAVHMQRKANLLHLIGATGTIGSLTGRLHGGQEQTDQRGDDRDHHQQFDEREASSLRVVDDA